MGKTSKEDLASIVGQRLKELRKAKTDLGQKDVADEIGITKQIDPDWIVNMSVAKTLKKELPYDVWQKARKLYLYDGQAARP